jgi:hypothetical protein
MAAATILQIGNDACRRSLVLARAGFRLRQCEERTEAVAEMFAAQDPIGAVVFEASYHAAPHRAVVRLARCRTSAPLILFENSACDCDVNGFDLVIPVLTAPALWLFEIERTIARSRELTSNSAQLRMECADVWAESKGF